MSMARAQLGPTPRKSAPAPSSRTMRKTPSKLREAEAECERTRLSPLQRSRRHANLQRRRKAYSETR